MRKKLKIVEMCTEITGDMKMGISPRFCKLKFEYSLFFSSFCPPWNFCSPSKRETYLVKMSKSLASRICRNFTVISRFVTKLVWVFVHPSLSQQKSASKIFWPVLSFNKVLNHNLSISPLKNFNKKNWKIRKRIHKTCGRLEEKQNG